MGCVPSKRITRKTIEEDSIKTKSQIGNTTRKLQISNNNQQRKLFLKKLQKYQSALRVIYEIIPEDEISFE